MDTITIDPARGAAPCSRGIFAAYAEVHWDAGLPVIPTRPGEKRPALSNWSVFCRRMPTAEERARLLRQHAEGGIGLPLGEASGVEVIDIDTKDPILRRAIDEVMPPSPWHRVGKKGVAYA